MSEENKNQEETQEFSRDVVKHDFAKIQALSISKLNRRLRSSTIRQLNILDEDRLNDEMSRGAINPVYLREVSKALYVKSSQYRRIINYFSDSPLLNWIIIPNEDTDLKTYRSVNVEIEKLNLEHEAKKMFRVLYKTGSYYGIVIDAKSYIHFVDVDADLVQLVSISDGLSNFAVATHFFDDDDISVYSTELRNAIILARNGNEPYVVVPSQDSISLKIDEDVEYSVPPFSGSFKSILELEQYKKLRTIRDKLNTLKIIVQKIPVRDGSNKNDDFAIEANTVALFHDLLADSLPEEIMLATTPMDVSDISLKQNITSDTDNVSKAESNFWNTNGVSEALFGKATNAIGLSYSIKVDESTMFMVLRQLERWVNRRVKGMAGKKSKVKYKILDMTEYNKDDYIETLLKNAQFGLPVKLELASALGYNPREAIDMINFENNVLKLHENMIPLQSSHVTTETGTDPNGRPQKGNTEDVTDGAERARDNNS